MAIQPQTTMVEYKNKAKMDHGVQQMTRQGWRVISTTTVEQRSGCMRFIMLGGIGALVFKPKPHYLVTFTR